MKMAAKKLKEIATNPVILEVSKIDVRVSPIHGLGIFAKKRIKKGEVIAVNPTLDDIPVMAVRGCILSDYVFNGETRYDKSMILGPLALLNHSETDETAEVWSDEIEVGGEDIPIVKLMALKDIKKDEEILIDYGWNPGDRDDEDEG
jgi:hypothetical protein